MAGEKLNDLFCPRGAYGADAVFVGASGLRLRRVVAARATRRQRTAARESGSGSLGLRCIGTALAATVVWCRLGFPYRSRNSTNEISGARSLVLTMLCASNTNRTRLSRVSSLSEDSVDRCKFSMLTKWTRQRLHGSAFANAYRNPYICTLSAMLGETGYAKETTCKKFQPLGPQLNMSERFIFVVGQHFFSL